MNKTFEKINNNWDTIINKLLEDNDSFSLMFFNTFIKGPLKLLKYEKNTLYIEVPEKGYINILKNKLVPEFLKVSIADVIDNININNFNIEFVTKDNIFINKEELEKSILEERLKKLKIDINFTFENFVEGESNRLAYATSLAVAENLGSLYNPLFIYGETGLGKTHLLHSIANLALKNNENLNVVYISSQDFITEYMQSLTKHKTDELREIYKNLDLLIIDDIQFFSDKIETQNIFFDIFNTLKFNNKQVVLSSDKPVKKLIGIQERLLSRFSNGISCDVKLPDYETRKAILVKKIELIKPIYLVDEEVINYIALNIKTNIRDLEGCLNKIIAVSGLEKNNIDLDRAKDLLTDFTQEKNKKITAEKIIKTVSETLNVDIMDICGKQKKSEFVYARNICIYLCRELIQELTQEQIGKFFNKDHSTIIHSYKQINNNIEKNKTLKHDIETIKSKI